MNQLDRMKLWNETDKQYNKRVADFYKAERAELKEHRPIRLRTQGRDLPKDLAEIVWRLHIQREATYYVDNHATHCEAMRSRTENDLYLLIRYYINPNVKFKFASELLWGMSEASILHCGFCNTIHRHTYTPTKLGTTEDNVRKYLEAKGLNLKLPKE